ncbi:MAG: hypothetical protein ABIG71_01085, partial [Candidatus Uhrbacteria bacterium]
EKEVTQGLLSDTNGERVTLEQLHAVRSRSVNAPSVETRHREADKPVGDLIDLIDPQYAEGDGDDISVLELDGPTVKALRDAEIHRVGQLRRSGDELLNIRGIGEKRGAAIQAALVGEQTA